MAENTNKISQVQIENTTYDICDATARDKISNIEKGVWKLGVSGTANGGITTLPSTGTYLFMTAHDSTLNLNGLWIIRTGQSNAFKIAGGAGVNITVSQLNVTVTPTVASTVNVYYQKMPTL